MKTGRRALQILMVGLCFLTGHGGDTALASSEGACEGCGQLAQTTQVIQVGDMVGRHYSVPVPASRRPSQVDDSQKDAVTVKLDDALAGKPDEGVALGERRASGKRATAPLALYADRFTTRVLSKAQAFNVPLSESDVDDFLFGVIRNDLVASKSQAISDAKSFADLYSYMAHLDQLRLVESLLIRFGDSSRDLDHEFVVRLKRMVETKRTSSARTTASDPA